MEFLPVHTCISKKGFSREPDIDGFDFAFAYEKLKQKVVVNCDDLWDIVPRLSCFDLNNFKTTLMKSSASESDAQRKRLHHLRVSASTSIRSLATITTTFLSRCTYTENNIASDTCVQYFVDPIVYQYRDLLRKTLCVGLGDVKTIEEIEEVGASSKKRKK